MLKQKIPAVYMRGGASKAVFFHERDLPVSVAQREAVLLRILGNSQAAGKPVDSEQIDGMGGATTNTSKVAIVRPSTRVDSDVDFIFAAISPGQSQIDWSGNCTHISAAVGAFALQEGLVSNKSHAVGSPASGEQLVRIWQVNLGKRIDAYVPVGNGEVLESGSFEEDSIAHPSAEIRLEFLMPADDDGTAQVDQFMDSSIVPLLPTGRAKDVLSVPGLGKIEVTFLNAGQPTVFVRAQALGLTGKEPLEALHKNVKLLEKIEAVRALSANAMGASLNANMARSQGSTASVSQPSLPTVAWLAKPQTFSTTSGRAIQADEIDIVARMMVMGRIHPSYSGVGSISLGIAAALPGTIAHEIARTLPGIPTRIGHVSGLLAVGAEVAYIGDRWVAQKALLSRSARRLMSGWVYTP